MDALVECQVPDDADDVPLDLQGVPAQLINPLEELQATVGNDVVAVALDLRMTCCSSESTAFTRFTHPGLQIFHLFTTSAKYCTMSPLAPDRWLNFHNLINLKCVTATVHLRVLHQRLQAEGFHLFRGNRSQALGIRQPVAAETPKASLQQRRSGLLSEDSIGPAFVAVLSKIQ